MDVEVNILKQAVECAAIIVLFSQDKKKNHEIFGESVSTSTQCSRYKFRRSEEYVMLLLIITDMRKRVTVHATLMFHCSMYLLNNLLSEFL